MSDERFVLFQRGDGPKVPFRFDPAAIVPPNSFWEKVWRWDRSPIDLLGRS